MHTNVNPYRKKVFTLIALLVIPLAARAGVSHQAFDEILSACVHDGRVHYGTLRGLEPALDRYLATLASAKPESLETPEERKAFWINAYNACVLKNVLDAYPISRPSDVSGFFDIRRRKLMGLGLTLDDIATDKLRTFRDPRLLCALSCGALGGPAPRAHAWSSASLGLDLDAAVRELLSDPVRGASIAMDGTLMLNALFRRYAKEFGGDEGVLHFIHENAPKTISERAGASPPPKVAYLEFDWTLNAAELVGVKRLQLW